MIIFLITVRHPENSVDYLKIELLLEQTIRSACNQTSSDFKVVVVCNKVPKIDVNLDLVDFVKVDFQPPSKLLGSKMDIDEVRVDQGSKKVVGLLHAQKYAPDYVMFLDADDFVSNQIAQYVNSRKKENGWFIQKGYIYGSQDGLIRKTNEFHMKCGSSHIINYNLFEIPDCLSPNSSLKSIKNHMDDFYLRKVLGSHRWIRDYFDKKGLHLKSIPFPGAIWVLDTGENHSGKSLLGVGYPVNPKVCLEFSVEPPKISFQLAKSYLSKLPHYSSSIIKKVIQKQFR